METASGRERGGRARQGQGQVRDDLGAPKGLPHKTGQGADSQEVREPAACTSRKSCLGRWNSPGRDPEVRLNQGTARGPVRLQGSKPGASEVGCPQM